MIGISNTEAMTGAVLHIDLDAVQNNYRTLVDKLSGVPSAAVVKADGYGLGAKRVCPALAAAGCRVFFVAHLTEGIAIRTILPDTEIHILNGLMPDSLDAYREHRLIPVLGSLGDIATWRSFSTEAPLPCDIHVDTGMLRLGLPPDELDVLVDAPDKVIGMNICLVMSHLASADEVGSDQNLTQLAAFVRAREILPMGQACLANSSGIFLGTCYHFDMVRPGIALYGGNPTPGEPNPMVPTVTLKGRITQVRHATTGDTVGYNATYRVEDNALIATVSVGYADGYLRSLSGVASGMIDGIMVPLVGRVSMDLITFDVSAVRESARQPGQWIELIGPNITIDSLAATAGTISYEILTSLGQRYHRVYLGGVT